MADHAPGCRVAMLQPSMDCPDCMGRPDAQPCATCNPGAVCSCAPVHLDCGEMGDEACGHCGRCWRLAALQVNVELIDARHILSRLVTTIRWICESRPDVAAALEINLAWIRAVELLETHCPEEEAPCSPET